MGLSLAAPLLLVGLAFVALPVVAHLTGYQEVRMVDFPTLRFLRASELKVRRRTRLESLALLALRALAVAALAFLFARPSVTWTATALAGLDPGRTTLVLVDASASMHSTDGSGSVFDTALLEARRLLEGLAPGTLAAVLTFDSRPQVRGSGLTADHSGLLHELDQLAPGGGSTDLDRALRRALEVLRDGGVGSANIFVLSDGSATRMPAVADWPDGYTVHYHDLLERTVENRFVSSTQLRSGLQRGEGLHLDVEVRSVGPRPSVPLPLTLRVGSTIEVVSDVTFDAEGLAERSFSLPMPPEGQLLSVLELPADGLPVDDRWHTVLEGDSTLDVLLVSGDGGANPRDDEVYYLQKALMPGAGSTSRIRPRVVKAEELKSIGGDAGDVIFLCNVADPRPLAAELQAFVRRGGGLFVSVGSRVDPDLYNTALPGLLPAEFTELKTRGRGTFEQTPMGLSIPPLEEEEFRIFRSGGAGVFARVGFGKVLGTAPRLKEDSEVLLRYTDGLPALLERRVGDGRVVLFTSTLDDDWTDFPLRSIYVALVHQFARSLSGTLLLEGGSVVAVGDTLPLPAPPDLELQAWVVGPDGREQSLDRGSADAEGRIPFRGTRVPGHYSLYWETRGPSDEAERGQLKALFSVRVPEDESLLRPADRKALLAAVPGLVHHGAGSSTASDAPGKVVRTASLGPGLLALLALCLVGEAVLAGRQT